MIKSGLLRAEQERDWDGRVTKAKKKIISLIVPAPSGRQRIPVRVSDFRPWLGVGGCPAQPPWWPGPGTGASANAQGPGVTMSPSHIPDAQKKVQDHEKSAVLGRLSVRGQRNVRTVLLEARGREDPAL